MALIKVDLIINYMSQKDEPQKDLVVDVSKYFHILTSPSSGIALLLILNKSIFLKIIDKYSSEIYITKVVLSFVKEDGSTTAPLLFTILDEHVRSLPNTKIYLLSKEASFLIDPRARAY